MKYIPWGGERRGRAAANIINQLVCIEGEKWNKNSSIAEIKLSNYNMAKKFHPDSKKILDARQMFSLIAEAYGVLSDETRRAKYDETGLGEEQWAREAAGG